MLLFSMDSHNIVYKLQQYMNHILELNSTPFVIRQLKQKIMIFALPALTPIYKHYAFANYSYLNPYTKQLLLIHKNQITIFKTALLPLQLVVTQKNFIEWQPQGGILLKNKIILFGQHNIGFYERTNLLDKSWQIEIVQQIQEIKSSKGDNYIAMKVSNPNNTLFIWNVNVLTMKPSQEIILTEKVLQWEFVDDKTLAVLTVSDFRLYMQDANANQFNLYHFYQLKYNSFCWIATTSQQLLYKQSLNTVIFMSQKGEATFVQLYDIAKRTKLSQLNKLAQLKLVYKDINMKKVKAICHQNNTLLAICQTENRHLFSLTIATDFTLSRTYSNEEMLGSSVTEVYGRENLILAKDRAKWKYYLYRDEDDLQLLSESVCQRAFIGANKDEWVSVDKQTIGIIRNKGAKGQNFPFKYSDASKIHLLGIQNKEYYFVLGIRFYKLTQAGVSSIGFAIRNEKAVLQEVNSFINTIQYKIGDQYMLMKYKINNGKVTLSSIKSSTFPTLSLRSGQWIQHLPEEIRVGEGEKLLTIFPIARLLKLLDSNDQVYKYNLYGTAGNGLSLVIKNYVFFLQLVEDEKGCELVLLKRFNHLLYVRFSNLSHSLKLIEPDHMIFWVGNTLKTINSSIDQHNIIDPYALPETLLSRQLEIKKVYPPHHPKLLISLLQTNRIEMLLQTLHVIYDWFSSGSSTTVIFKRLSLQFFGSCPSLQQVENNISRLSAKKVEEQVQFLGRFSKELLQRLQGIQLKQNNSLYFETILSSLSYALKNAKAIDEFSQILMILAKTPFRPKKYNSMHIALLSHSLNKEEALSELRKDVKMSWDIMKQFSIPLWYDNKEQIKQLIEQLAGNQYRSKKDPFDCLFWYIFIGKKTLIGNLFKNHKTDSKEHDAITAFLQRDFNQAKDRTAAVKNAYVLFDKKRYFHAMAFFILGNNIDDCLRICLDRLKDINLAFLFLLFYKQAKTDYFQSQIKKGDAWMRHLSFKMEAKYILAYNSLFQPFQSKAWGYEPELCGFHPYLYQFGLKMKNSVGVKRQQQLQTQAQSTSQDIFADFYEQQTKTQVAESKQQLALIDDYESLRSESILYYLKLGLPMMGLLQKGEDEACLQNYNFQKYKISGQMQESMQKMVVGLEDKLSIVKCFLQKSKLEQALDYIEGLCLRFQKTMKKVHLNEITQTHKYVIGSVLHMGYHLQQIKLYLLTRSQIFTQKETELQAILEKLGHHIHISKVISCLMLNFYEYLYDLLLHLKATSTQPEQSERLWGKLKAKYDLVNQIKQQKYLKQMDSFEHAFIRPRNKYDEETTSRIYLQLTRQEGSLLYFRLLVCNYLISKCTFALCDELRMIRSDVEDCIKNWLSQNSKKDIFFEYDVLIKQGTQYKAKLNFLKDVFHEEFIAFYDSLALIHDAYFEQTIGTLIRQEQTDLQGVQIFRNRQDGMKSFIINRHDSKGLQCIVMFKRGLKKFQVCENLIKRQRTKDHYSLTSEDGFNTALTYPDPQSYGKIKNAGLLQQTLAHILDVKRINNAPSFPKEFTSYNEKEYMRPIDPAYLDYNELNSIECHPHLPFFLIGGKSYIELAHLATLKNFDRIKCPNMSEIVRLHSCEQRIGAIDSLGSFGVYNFDNKYTNACVYSIRKMSLIDFTFIRPSLLATISSNSLCVYDTLIHPTKQLKFKQPFTKDPLALATISERRIAVLRKHELLTYDIRIQKVESSRQVKGKGRSLLLSGEEAYVGLSDGRVKVFSLLSEKEEVTIRLGNADEKQRQRISVDQLSSYGSVILASTTQGSLFYLPTTSP